MAPLLARLLALLAALMAGCMTLPAKPRPSPAPSPVAAEKPPLWIKPGMPNPTGPAVLLLYYADYVRTLPPNELARETERVRRLSAANKSDFLALQYCFALLAQGDEWHRCQPVVEPLAKPANGRDAELRALAGLVQADLLERHRLETAGRRAEDHAGELEKQLDELKTIERNLLQRNGEPGEKP